VTRAHLPERRFSVTVDVEHTLVNEGKMRFAVTYGFADGTVREVFTSTPKSGTDFEVLAVDASILLSHLLQNGYRIGDCGARLSKPYSFIGTLAKAGARLERELDGAKA
jgi:hypothetical protein